jgi:ubiquinone/menaquinone biosynthesis C-methylase UbiE
MRAGAGEHIKDLNVRYHDVAASDYDFKWNISFDGEGRATVQRKLRRALGEAPGQFGRALEIGAGTGYFSLNLLATGVIRDAVATDISQGMLDALSARAQALDLSIETARCEAAELPFADSSFDLVLGHAVLHHLPDLDAAFAEFRRVLRPGGTLAFCGEPSRHGDRIAALPKRAAMAAAPVWRAFLGVAERSNGRHEETLGHELELSVDVHSFTPRELRACARRAGFRSVRLAGEELTASWFGWANRTLEASAEPDAIPSAWRWYAYGGYLALRALDRAVLEPRLPPAIFYNLLISARSPDD